MEALKRSLARDTDGEGAAAEATPKRAKAAPDQRQPGLLLPVSGAVRARRNPLSNRQLRLRRSDGRRLEQYVDRSPARLFWRAFDQLDH